MWLDTTDFKELVTLFCLILDKRTYVLNFPPKIYKKEIEEEK
jgi:hypothetical protein